MKKLWIIALLLAACGTDLEKPDFITSRGLEVIIGAKNAPDINTIENWTNETLVFWWDFGMIECSIDSVDGTRVKFRDALFLRDKDRKAWGFAFPWYKYIEIAGLGSPYIKSIFMHELSHIIVYDCRGLDDEAESHQFFADHSAPF